MLDLLLTLHVLAAATWFGSGLAMNVLSRRLLRGGPGSFASFVGPANWWAGRAHPGAGLVLLITGPAIVSKAGYDFGDPWVIIALVGLIALFALGGAVVGKTAGQVADRIEAGAPETEIRAGAEKLHKVFALETAVLGLIIVDMVVKPGL